MPTDREKQIIDVAMELFRANHMALHALINALVRQGDLRREDFTQELELLRQNAPTTTGFTDSILNSLSSAIESSTYLAPLSREQLLQVLEVIDGGKPPEDDK